MNFNTAKEPSSSRSRFNDSEVNQILSFLRENKADYKRPFLSKKFLKKPRNFFKEMEKQLCKPRRSLKSKLQKMEKSFHTLGLILAAVEMSLDEWNEMKKLESKRGKRANRSVGKREKTFESPSNLWGLDHEQEGKRSFELEDTIFSENKEDWNDTIRRHFEGENARDF